MNLDGHPVNANFDANGAAYPTSPISESIPDSESTQPEPELPKTPSKEISQLITHIGKMQHRTVAREFHVFLLKSQDSIFDHLKVRKGVAYIERMVGLYLKTAKFQTRKKEIGSKKSATVVRQSIPAKSHDDTGGDTMEPEVGPEADSSPTSFQSEINNPEDDTDSEPEDPREALRRKRYDTLDSELEKSLEKLLEVVPEDLKSLVEKCLLLRSVNAQKYYRVSLQKELKKPASVVQCPYPETAEEVMKLLEGDEEACNPWAASRTPPLPGRGMLMRLWDRRSQCQWTHLGIQSGGSASNFGTRAGRKKDITSHGKWFNHSPTPFISAGSSLTQLVNHRIPWFLGPRRSRNPNGPLTLKFTLINSKARLAAKWPVIRMRTQIEYYKCKELTSGSRTPEFYDDEYLLPFRIGKDQIVGTWCWHKIEQYMIDHGCDFRSWFNTVAVRAFDEHEAARLEGRDVRIRGGCTCCGF